ncbi:MAG TPA: HepT-like ribonuclease domain-containing protein [Chloroflexota bacterium]|jgi:uncharacterized protein with HEPN domain
MYVDDDTRMRHIRDAAQEALRFVKDRNRADLDTDRMLYRALVACISEIGEAASKLTPGARAALSQVPWNQIVGMRNQLVHGYYQINPDTIWDTVTADLAPLIAAVEHWLASQADTAKASDAREQEEEAPC